MNNISRYLLDKYNLNETQVNIVFIVYKLQNDLTTQLLQKDIEELSQYNCSIRVIVLCKSDFNIDLNSNSSVEYMYESESMLWYSIGKFGLSSMVNGLDDIVISYSSIVTSYYLTSLNLSSHKIAFIDDAFDINHSGYTKDYLMNIYNNIDCLLFASNEIKNRFIEYIGDYLNSELIYSEIEYDSNVINKSKHNESHIFNIVSVGRLSVDKGFDKLIKVHKRLLDEGIINKVTVVGEGFDRNIIEDIIRKNQVEETFILEGYKPNPYQYIKEADLFVLASKNEGLPLVIMESMILEKAIVATNVNGIRELLRDGYGLLVEDSEEGLYSGIKEMIINDKKRDEYIKKLRSDVNKFKFDSKLIAPVIEDLFESNISKKTNDKKNILMVLQIMAGGGCEKAFLNTLDIIDYNKYNIDVVVLIKHMGDLYEYNPNVNVRYIYDNLFDFYNNYNPNLKFDLSKEYDLEIAYSDIVSSEFILNSGSLNSKKIAWIHGDIRFFEASRSKDHIKNIYDKIDKIICVSNDSRDILIDYLGESVENKVEVIYNPMPINQIKSMAGIPGYATTSVCVSRLSYEKGIDRLIRAHKRLIDEGIISILKIVGDGCLKDSLNQLIKDLGISDTCKLVGYKENPYKIMKDSDLIISPSRQEGFGIAMAEAMVLEKPVLATATSGAIDLLEYKYGLVTMNTEEDLYQGMKNLICDSEHREFYKNNIRKIKQLKFDKNCIIPQIEKALDVKPGKNKILFTILGFWGGGGETSIINTLNNLDTSKYDIDLQILVESDIMLEKIDRSKINVLPYLYKTESELNDDINNKSLKFNINTYYDVEVAYLGRQSIEFIVEKGKNSSKKIAWIHGDVSFTIGDKDIEYIKNLFNNMDEVICVSKGVKKQFIEYIGESNNYKLNIIYPPVDIDVINEKLI